MMMRIHVNKVQVSIIYLKEIFKMKICVMNKENVIFFLDMIR